MPALEIFLRVLKPDELRKAAPVIKATTIGYDFTFDISEGNDIGGANANDSFLTFKNGKKFTSDLMGSATLERKNFRRFTVIEPLAALAEPEHRRICSDRTARANWAYPIGGAIGMDEVVHTYLKLEMLGELKQVRNRRTGEVFADTLKFTTNLEAGATTKLVLDAVVGQVKVSNASIGVGASRDDVHTVIVALSRKAIDVDEPKSKAAKAKVEAMQAAKDYRFDVLQRDNIRDPRTQGRAVQEDEDVRTRVAIELYRRRDLSDVDNEPAEALGQRLLDVLRLP